MEDETEVELKLSNAKNEFRELYQLLNQISISLKQSTSNPAIIDEKQAMKQYSQIILKAYRNSKYGSLTDNLLFKHLPKNQKEISYTNKVMALILDYDLTVAKVNVQAIIITQLLLSARRPQLVYALAENNQTRPSELLCQYMHYHVIPAIFSKLNDRNDVMKFCDLVTVFPMGFTSKSLTTSEIKEFTEFVQMQTQQFYGMEGLIKDWGTYCSTLIYYSGEILHHHNKVTDPILNTIKNGFRVKSVENRLMAYDCWKTLICNYRMDEDLFNAPKQLSLLLGPLIVKVPMHPSIAIRRFDTCMLLMKFIKEPKRILPELLYTIFGPFDVPVSQYDPKAISIQYIRDSFELWNKINQFFVKITTLILISGNLTNAYRLIECARVCTYLNSYYGQSTNMWRKCKSMNRKVWNQMLSVLGIEKKFMIKNIGRVGDILEELYSPKNRINIDRRILLTVLQSASLHCAIFRKFASTELHKFATTLTRLVISNCEKKLFVNHADVLTKEWLKLNDMEALANFLSEIVACDSTEEEVPTEEEESNEDETGCSSKLDTLKMITSSHRKTRSESAESINHDKDSETILPPTPEEPMAELLKRSDQSGRRTQSVRTGANELTDVKSDKLNCDKKSRSFTQPSASPKNSVPREDTMTLDMVNNANVTDADTESFFTNEATLNLQLSNNCSSFVENTESESNNVCSPITSETSKKFTKYFQDTRNILPIVKIKIGNYEPKLYSTTVNDKNSEVIGSVKTVSPKNIPKIVACDSTVEGLQKKRRRWPKKLNALKKRAYLHKKTRPKPAGSINFDKDSKTIISSTTHLAAPTAHTGPSTTVYTGPSTAPTAYTGPSTTHLTTPTSSKGPSILPSSAPTASEGPKTELLRRLGQPRKGTQSLRTEANELTEVKSDKLNSDKKSPSFTQSNASKKALRKIRKTLPQPAESGLRRSGRTSAKLLNSFGNVNRSSPISHGNKLSKTLGSPQTSRIHSMNLDCAEDKKNNFEINAQPNPEDILTFNREITSPLAAPKIASLKRSSNVLDNTTSPFAKRKRERNFSDSSPSSEKTSPESNNENKSPTKKVVVRLKDQMLETSEQSPIMPNVECAEEEQTESNTEKNNSTSATDPLANDKITENSTVHLGDQMLETSEQSPIMPNVECAEDDQTESSNEKNNSTSVNDLLPNEKIFRKTTDESSVADLQKQIRMDILTKNLLALKACTKNIFEYYAIIRKCFDPSDLEVILNE